MYAVQTQRRECRKLLTNYQRPPYFLAEAITGCIYIEFYHRANNRGKYADGLCNSIIDDKDGQIPSPLIVFTCTALCYALLEWQKNKGVPPKASKLKLKANRPHHSNYFNYKKDRGKDASCCAATGRKFLTSPGVADMYTFLMNTWNTLPESYQERVYIYTLATVKCQIQQVVNPTPVEVISREAAPVDNAILYEYLTSGVALEEPEIGSTDVNNPIDNNSTDDELHSGMPGRSGDYEDEAEESNVLERIPTASWQQRPATELERFDLRTSDVDGYEGEDGNDAYADEEEEASQTVDGSTRNVED